MSKNKVLRFGLKKSKLESHEHMVSFNYDKVDFPIKFNLKYRVKQVYDHKNLNTCSANATASLISMSTAEIYIRRLYLYFCTRWLDNNMILPVQDQGGTLRSVLNAFKYH